METQLKKSDFHYDLPPSLIAQDPLADRASSRLMVLDRSTGAVEHRHFADIKKYLRPGDCLVINDTKVLPARLIFSKGASHFEILLLRRVEEHRWECLVKPGKKAREGDAGVIYEDGSPLLTAHIEAVLPSGNRIVRFEYVGVWEEILDRVGTMPLPPYIKNRLSDATRYQTVYARYEGSAAAPTAGLHFTQDLLREISAMGVEIAHVTLHIGLGTFRPVKEEVITDHVMHSEWYEVAQSEADKINAAKQSGHRVICVGTTSCRTLESVADEHGNVCARSGETDIFIYPGYTFKVTDMLVTNFHLPESTLIMLVSAFAGRENVLRAYNEAVNEGYRFFSFGDAMVVGTPRQS